jgi:hypothetical protein
MAKTGPNAYTKRQYARDFASQVPYWDKVKLERIGAVFVERRRDVKIIANQLCELELRLRVHAGEDAFEKVIDCVYAALQLPVPTNNRNVIDAGGIVVRLNNLYRTLNGEAKIYFSDMLNNGPVDPKKLQERIASVELQNVKVGDIALNPRDGISRPRAYGTKHCAHRMNQHGTRHYRE